MPADMANEFDLAIAGLGGVAAVPQVSRVTSPVSMLECA
jgi:hypothetical protein